MDRKKGELQVKKFYKNRTRILVIAVHTDFQVSQVEQNVLMPGMMMKIKMKSRMASDDDH